MNFSWSLAGVRASTVPCEPGRGLAVGVQIVGQWSEEARIIGAAAAYQRASRWHLAARPR